MKPALGGDGAMALIIGLFFTFMWGQIFAVPNRLGFHRMTFTPAGSSSAEYLLAPGILLLGRMSGCRVVRGSIWGVGYIVGVFSV